VIEPSRTRSPEFETRGVSPAQEARWRGGGEAGDVADLGDDEEGDEETDAGDPGEDRNARVVLGAGADLPLDGRELAVEVSDQGEQALEPAAGALRQRQLVEEASPLRPEQLAVAVLHALGMTDAEHSCRSAPNAPSVSSDTEQHLPARPSVELPRAFAELDAKLADRLLDLDPLV
jgi:hypothetical protein